MKSLRKYLKKEEKLLEEYDRLLYEVNECDDDSFLPDLEKVNVKLIKVREKILFSIRQELEVRGGTKT